MTIPMPIEGGKARSALPVRLLFTGTIFLGSFLLFLTQPMVARMALPHLGGAPAVWNSAMLLYQALLLAGYGYAHWLGRWPGRSQAGIHLGLFALASLTLPIGITALAPAAGVEPALWVLYLLGVSIAPLFFVISAQAPLMQAWFARTDDPRAHDPYFLYAASNIGSFSGLIAYPLLMEPLLPLSVQSWVWSAGFVLLALCVGVCGLALPRSGLALAVTAAPRPPIAWRRRLHWIALAAVPSGLMLSTTTHITTEVMAAPLLWVIPLGLYLLSFVLAFRTPGALTRRLIAAAPFVLLLIGSPLMIGSGLYPLAMAAGSVIMLFFVSLALHARMAADRPGAESLTDFYLMMSVGGVVGGLFSALIAPLLFNWTWEHPLLIMAAAALMPTKALFDRKSATAEKPAPRLAAALLLSLAADSGRWTELPAAYTLAFSIPIALWTLRSMGQGWRFALFFGLLMMSYGGWSNLGRSADPGMRERSYFGLYSIGLTANGEARYLQHGTTMHGMQSVDPARATIPGSYYAPGSGAGLAFGKAGGLYGKAARLGVVGLGTGTLACYARSGQRWTLYEIDPLMVEIARDPTRFSFLDRCLPDAKMVIGDARLTLERAPTASYDILAIDAFSSDAIPMHLLTDEAFSLYARVLAKNGLLLVHISNRYIDLRPVLAEIAARQGWTARIRNYFPDAAARENLASRSMWVALSRDPAMVEKMIGDSAKDRSSWQSLARQPGFRPWTDDFASVLPILK